MFLLPHFKLNLKFLVKISSSLLVSQNSFRSSNGILKTEKKTQKGIKKKVHIIIHEEYLDLTNWKANGSCQKWNWQEELLPAYSLNKLELVAVLEKPLFSLGQRFQFLVL